MDDAMASVNSADPAARVTESASAASRATTGPQPSPAERITQGLVALVLAASLMLGLVLTPSPTGTGTHTILGLPPCGMLVTTGHPCPTCGVTTSFILAAHGRLYDALITQPFGVFVFLGVVGGLAFSLISLVRRHSWRLLATPYRLTILALVVVVLALVSWAYKWATM